MVLRGAPTDRPYVLMTRIDFAPWLRAIDAARAPDSSEAVIIGKIDGQKVRLLNRPPGTEDTSMSLDEFGLLASAARGQHGVARGDYSLPVQHG